LESLRRLVHELTTAGYQLDRGAYDYLKSMVQPEAETFARSLLLKIREKRFEARILTKQELESIKAGEDPAAPPRLASVSTRIPAKEISSRLEILRDPAKEIGTGGDIDDFSHYFRDRFHKLSAAFHQRTDARDATSIGLALKAAHNDRVKFLGMVMEKRERQRRLFLQLDDLEDTATVLVTPEERTAYDVAQKTPLDQVICVAATRSRGDLFVAKEIFLPDIPERKPRLADENVWAVLLSDMHVGSNKFLGDAFSRVLEWLNLRVGAPNLRAIAERTKYVVICGDIVDGIGIYPRQEQELAIKDLHDQYREAAKFIGMIPDHMETIVIPGNHDAVRQALPQPAIPKDFGEPIYDAREIVSLGNPSEVGLHGVRLLLHHGRSLDDVIAGAPSMDFTQPEKAMRLQLQCRHLASEYGNRTSLAPEKVDHLVIEKPPDIFQSGHIHVVKHENYRGTLIVNSGAWQAQTDYQRRVGLIPTPGILTAVNLQNLQVQLIRFLE